MAAYTLRGTRTTADFRSFAPPPGRCGPISVGKSRSSSFIVASTISSSVRFSQSTFPPASGAHGAKTSSSIDLSSSLYSLQQVLMSAYTDSKGLRLKQRWSTFRSFRSNHRWMLMTGMPSSSSICRKKGMFAHSLGTRRFMMSHGTADTYSSATTCSPPRRSRCFTLPSELTTMESNGQLSRTSPPLASMCSFIGAQSRSG
mmetsp:Transcript_64023/g.177635  ORF Transcript_64023/g.177635 Transcript_64023/m.177635 type:complete len:201 (-) Transcript_64023:1014-1616(-)